MILFYGIGLTLAVILMICSMMMGRKQLNSIKSTEVGDGQYGRSRFMTEKEKKKFYETVKLPKEFVDMSDCWKPGRVIGYDPKKREMLVDTSDTHASIMAPSGTGKTTKYLVPNIQYNLMAGTSMIVPDLKGENRKLTEADARKLGYKVYSFDFIDLIDSNTFDFLEDINENMDVYLRTQNILAKANSESLAGELADEITSSKERGSGDNSFFLGASKGLLQSVILLVSMFGNRNEKHLSSVRAVLQNIAAMPKNPKNPVPAIIQLMADMPDDFGPKKQMGAAFAASNETEDNIYSSALDDLRPFNNALAEQIFSVPQKPGLFSYKDFLAQKSIVYIVLPDEKTEFKIFGKILMKKIIQQLGNLANTYPERRLPKVVKVMWEEFAEYPKIENVGSWLQVKRGQGVLFDLIYQEEAALRDKYGENIPTVLKNNCGCSIILGVAQEDERYAEKLSKILGNQTIRSGSVSTSYQSASIGSKNYSTTEQMMGKPLMSVDEILRMEQNNIQIVLRRGKYPMKTRLYPYYDKKWGLPWGDPVEHTGNNSQFYPVEYINFEELKVKLKDYQKESKGYSREFSKDLNTDAFKQACRTIYEKTQDQQAVQLFMNKDWGEFMSYMAKNHPKLRKYELIKLIQELDQE